MSARNLLIALAACLVAALPVRADEGWASRDYDFAKNQMNDFVSRFQRDLVDPVSRGVRNQRPGARAARAGATSTTVPERAAQVPRALASVYPPAERARMEKIFRELLVGYGKFEQHYRLPRRDLAGAVAAFVGGAYMGYRNTTFPDEYFPPMVEQFRSIIASDPAFAKAPTAARQEMYEQLAILGMFMANAQMALRQRPDPQIEARVRAAGKAYLEQFLKTDAERVQITAQGLVLR
ncbi:DUF6683 family protein [Piscinibacter sp. XHJ-5]|uniref:DUF6683 family protein n=1 Tax=Piscinibacter sp. XHJ-5 TaxID=3037797 RepID=UPI002452B7C2|nr:DUF6683 family protein [Piscinibacter sp. XHJ-5]